VKESKATTRAMPTIQVGSGSSLELQDVADIMGKSRKVVVVTGAGISTNCGIPVSDIQTIQNIIWNLVDAFAGLSVRTWPILLDSSSIRRSCTESALGTRKYLRH
jgi:hypothetical protein